MRIAAGHSQQVFEAEFHVVQQLPDVNAAEVGINVGHVHAKAGVHFSSATQVSALEVKQTDGRVNESLKKRFFGARQFGPKVFEHVVAGKEVLAIEQRDAFGDSGVVRIEAHRGIRGW